MIFPYIGIEISNLYSFTVFLDVLKDWFPPQKLRKKKCGLQSDLALFVAPQKSSIYIYMSWPEEGVTNQTSVLECYIYIYLLYIYIYNVYTLGQSNVASEEIP